MVVEVGVEGVGTGVVVVVVRWVVVVEGERWVGGVGWGAKGRGALKLVWLTRTHL